MRPDTMNDSYTQHMLAGHLFQFRQDVDYWQAHVHIKAHVHFSFSLDFRD